ncbi:cobalt-precorrin-5B (C(1))-methyltransferase [Waterburya agarophytonicola K14]|uniref:Cobalt-precorrin-5B C(1)-methyltransferase n=1 Tax=Waterburya agarophytonicola KI4 TaxID=2874699 RepID=A0A964C078_9CYAN|nr:cobalt-precorrin-5B (C(1))-methyltransferase CbiD [Waterburya agarophytonicola]MCC0179791.1 cobalt-precorrin-5B (C(1))-methyltransferase [Waterburya agarophytonicola KI4]
MPTGYTLPVFACASAIAALHHLHRDSRSETVEVNLIQPPKTVKIEIEQVALIDNNTAIAITKSDPGDHLDITRHTPIWAKVSFCNDSAADLITIEGGEGIGKQSSNENKTAIYSYARKLIEENLTPLLHPPEKIIITIILPEGKRLAKRTSNEAFGVVEGLSLLGTTGIVQPLVAPDRLETFQNQIQEKAALFDELVFCIGENGIDLAQKSGIDPQKIIKTANWLGSMLVTAGIAEVKSILLFGYHGKLIKLAGGIFHTHNHLADGRLEILTAYCAKLGLPQEYLKQIFDCPTTENALDILRELDLTNNTKWVEKVYGQLGEAIDFKSREYIRKYTEKKLCVGSIVFDRRREIIHKSNNALLLLTKLC